GQDIADMGQSSTEFRFAKASNKANLVRDNNGNGLPVTARTGSNQITMYMKSMSNLHEPRHGGQVARGEFDVLDALGTASSSAGASHEISAYRAEYLYIPVENHTIFQLKTIPFLNAYLQSFYRNERRVKNDKNEYETKNYPSQIPGWLFRTKNKPGVKD
ncbi:MAG: hypothetical protein KJO86_04600, partial [Muriicola sp.]|nr:hypothetical protein [Muriicola sp.]